MRTDTEAARGAKEGAEVRVNGVSLYCEERGEGEPIVCIHGTGGAAVVWGAALDELARRGRTIAYDRRGSFRSERPEPYETSLGEQRDDAAALVDALDAAPAILIGRSYGGQIALDVALRHPDRVRALVLLEPAGFWTASEQVERWYRALERQVLEAAERDPGRVGETFMRVVLGDAGWEALPRPLREVFVANGPAIAAEVRGGFPEVGAEELAALAHPTLLVAAGSSPEAFADVTRRLAEAIPAARLEWVEGGHLIDPAHPVVLGFVEEVLAGR